MMMSSFQARVLLVDDSAVLRKLAIVTLGGIGGYRIDEAADAREGLERASSERYDVVITDYYMPGLDGIEFMRQLRERDDYRDTPMVLVTSERDELITSEARDAGFDEVVLKPFEPTEMRSVLRALLEKARAPKNTGVVPLDAQGLLDSLPYPAMVLDAQHNVILGNSAFYSSTETGISDCSVICKHAMHENGMPANCPLATCVRTGGAVEAIVDEPSTGPLVVSVYPLEQTDERGGMLYLHLARPATP